MSERLIPPGYGQPNFKKPIKDRLKKKEAAQHSRPGNSEKHLALVRLLPCCICGKYGPGDPHHLRVAAERGVGRKATDRWAVPMCRTDHEAAHRVGSRVEQSWFAARGIDDVLGLANALWQSTGDLPKMIRILMEHRR
jgi:hypothetical protein